MEIVSPLPLAARIALTLDGLHAAVAARRVVSVLVGRGTQVLAAALIMVVCGRVRVARNRILGLLERFQAGRLRVWRPGRRAVGRRATERVVGGRRWGALKGVPQHSAWLLPLVPCEAANFASQLRGLLAEPEMAGLLAASAQARRILKPVCRMLGIEAEALEPSPSARADDPPAGAAAPGVWFRPRGRLPTARSGSGNPAGCPVPAD